MTCQFTTCRNFPTPRHPPSPFRVLIVHVKPSWFDRCSASRDPPVVLRIRRAPAFFVLAQTQPLERQHVTRQAVPIKETYSGTLQLISSIVDANDSDSDMIVPSPTTDFKSSQNPIDLLGLPHFYHRQAASKTTCLYI